MSNFATFNKEKTNKAWYSLLSQKLGNMAQNLSSAAVVIDAFELLRGEQNKKTLKVGHHRPASKRPLLEWRFAGGKVIAQQ